MVWWRFLFVLRLFDLGMRLIFGGLLSLVVAADLALCRWFGMTSICIFSGVAGLRFRVV